MRIITTTIILGLWMPVTAQSDVNVVPIIDVVAAKGGGCAPSIQR